MCNSSLVKCYIVINYTIKNCTKQYIFLPAWYMLLSLILNFSTQTHFACLYLLVLFRIISLKFAVKNHF